MFVMMMPFHVMRTAWMVMSAIMMSFRSPVPIVLVVMLAMMMSIVLVGLVLIFSGPMMIPIFMVTVGSAVVPVSLVILMVSEFIAMLAAFVILGPGRGARPDNHYCHNCQNNHYFVFHRSPPV